MLNFYLLLEKMETEEHKNIHSALKRLPLKHQELMHGFKVKLTSNNTIKNDDQHIGWIYKNKITISAPWNYGREMVFLHEIAHMVWEKLMTPELKKEWKSLLKDTKPEQIKKNGILRKKSLNQNDEELFAMAYAVTYSRHMLMTYANEQWQNFIKIKVPH
jgi:hypothetical protein